MGLQIPELRKWDQLPLAECEAIAKRLADSLPRPWMFRHVRLCQMGDQRRHVAYFDWNGLEFSLIVGGVMSLGYDRNKPLVLTDEQRKDYEEQSIRVSNFPPLQEHLNKRMTPLRQVTIEPFLLEIESGDATGLEKGFTNVTLADGVEIKMGYTKFKGGVPTHRQVQEQVERHGFRLPTSDEWEHACAAGSETLWRWGDSCPPVATEDENGSWDLNRKPNAFGLIIANDSYAWEWCSQPDVMRGGDGGNSVCGGEGDVAFWLTMSSRYVDPIVEWFGPDYLDEPFFGNVRRAMSLGCG